MLVSSIFQTVYIHAVLHMLTWARVRGCSQNPDFNKFFVSICFRLLWRGYLSEERRERERESDGLLFIEIIVCMFAIYIVYSSLKVENNTNIPHQGMRNTNEELKPSQLTQMYWKLQRTKIGKFENRFRGGERERERKLGGTPLRLELLYVGFPFHFCFSLL